MQRSNNIGNTIKNPEIRFNDRDLVQHTDFKI